MSANTTLPANTHITVDEHGMYHWRGTIDLRKNPTMTILVAKAVGIIVGILAVIFAGIILTIDVDAASKLSAFALMVGILALVVGVSVGCYFVYVAIVGGTYSADYLMDETGLMYRPAPKEDRIAKDIAVGTAVVSALAGSFGVTAASIAATNTESASIFKSVRKVKGIRQHCCIKVTSFMLFNQVYVAPEDYDFIYGFISSHCPQAKCFEV